MSDKLREAKDLVREADTLLQGRITGNLQLGKTDYKRLVVILSRDLPAALSAPQADAEPVAWECAGCGRICDDPKADFDDLKSRGFLSCCPERKMKPLYTTPPSQAADRMREALERIKSLCDVEDHPFTRLAGIYNLVNETLSRADDGKKSEGGGHGSNSVLNGSLGVREQVQDIDHVVGVVQGHAVEKDPAVLDNVPVAVNHGPAHIGLDHVIGHDAALGVGDSQSSDAQPVKEVPDHTPPDREAIAPKPHDWIKSTLGHGETMCQRCCITNREAAVLGRLSECRPLPRVLSQREKK